MVAKWESNGVECWQKESPSFVGHARRVVIHGKDNHGKFVVVVRGESNDDEYRNMDSPRNFPAFACHARHVVIVENCNHCRHLGNAALSACSACFAVVLSNLVRQQQNTKPKTVFFLLLFLLLLYCMYD